VSPPNYVTSVLLDSAGDAVQTQVNLDGMNRPYQRITSGSGSGAPIPPTVEVDTTYDAMGRVFTVTNPYTPPASPSGKITYYYDALGRKIEQVNQDGTKQWWCFENTQTGGQPNCNSHKTSAVGDWVDSADENKNEWQTTADGLGRITYVFEPSGGLSSGTYQAPTMETDYQYDGLGNLLSVAQKGRVGTDTARPTRSFIYDGLSRLTSSYNPESGTTTYIYDDVNGKVTKTAPAPDAPAGSSTTITATYAYNAFNQIISKSYSDSATTKTPTSCYIYGTPTNYTSGANQKRRLIYEWTQSASAGSCPGALPSTYLTMKYFTYDAMGRPNGTQQQQCSNGTHCVASSPYALSLSYYASGSLNTITNSVGNSGNPLTLTHSYDAGNHLMTLQSNWGGTYPAMLYSLNTASSSYGYNANGPTNWCMGASCTSNPPLSVTQGYDQYRLWVNNISVIGNVP
jgi:YD repeat-containing protein